MPNRVCQLWPAIQFRSVEIPRWLRPIGVLLRIFLVSVKDLHMINRMVTTTNIADVKESGGLLGDYFSLPLFFEHRVMIDFGQHCCDRSYSSHIHLRRGTPHPTYIAPPLPLYYFSSRHQCIRLFQDEDQQEQMRDQPKNLSVPCLLRGWGLIITCVPIPRTRYEVCVKKELVS